jgi:mono/diheme cytochrome c family protein
LIRLIGLRLVPLGAGVFLLWLGVLALTRPGTVARSSVAALGTVICLAVFAGGGYLFFAALRGPGTIPGPVANFVEQRMTEEQKQKTAKAKKFHEDTEEAERLAERSVNLAKAGIPAEGGAALLRGDPLTQGPKLFQTNCASCHTHGKDFDVKKPTASDLKGFGTEEWIFGLLQNPGQPSYFGRTGLGTMQEAIENSFPNVNKSPEEVAKLDADEKKQREQDLKDLRVLARWLAAHPRATSPERDEAWFKEGLEKFKSRDCTTCHAYEGKGSRKGPDLTGYGSADWLRVMIMAPYSRSRYGANNAMPAFRPFEGQLEDPANTLLRTEIENSRQVMLDAVRGMGKRAEDEKARIRKAHSKVIPLSDFERELIIRWVLQDYRVVFGGQPIGAAPKR